MSTIKGKAWLSLVLFHILIVGGLVAQNTYTVTTTNQTGTGSLGYGLQLANEGSVNIIDIPGGMGTFSFTYQLFIDANVTINGNGNVIDMNNQDRAFFIAGGTVNIDSLTIQNGNATGGSGADSGGGGAGLGGAIFVGSGTYDTANESPSVTGISVPNVTLSNMTFQNSQAVGGSGSTGPSGNGGATGGGGGMGGDAGSGYNDSVGPDGGGGGGGLGNGATGGTADPNSPGDGGVGLFSTTAQGGGQGGANHPGSPGGTGGAFGGGGGGAHATDVGLSTGGGGGIGGADGGYDASAGGAGGFGGGGGGGDVNNQLSGGAGGFGGGGGASQYGTGGAGGFGGGGGGGNIGGQGGFGGGNGAKELTWDAAWDGGGGMGAGGAIFAMSGAIVNIVDSAFSGNGVTGGPSGGPAGTGGSATGFDMFSGSDITVTVSGTNTQSMFNLGGAGNPNDPNISNNANDPNAQGGLIKQGTGTLILNGTENFYVGQTLIHQGTLQLSDGAAEVGTSTVIVGQNSGDNATLSFGNNAKLSMADAGGLTITVAEGAGSLGTVNIGSGAGSSGAFLDFTVITGGSGGTLNFNQQYSATGASEDYPFYITITGGLAVNQNGPGTTVLIPESGENVYNGGTVVNGGTLAYGAQNAVSPFGPITINSGGTIDLAGFEGAAGNVFLNGGTLTDSVGGGSLSIISITAQSGTIDAVLEGAGSFTQSGTGLTVISSAATYSGSTTVTNGYLQMGVENALPAGGDLTITGDGTLDLNGFDVTVGALVVSQSGGIMTSSGSGILTAESVVTENGGIAVTISGTCGVIQQGSGGLTTFGANNTYTGATVINGGSLVMLGTNATSGYTVNSGGSLTLAASQASFATADVNAGGTLTIFGSYDNVTANVLGGTVVVSGSNNTLDLAVDGGLLQILGQGNSGNVQLNEGQIDLQASLNLTNFSWEAGSSIAMTLGSAPFIDTQDFTYEVGGSGTNLFVFTVGPDVQVLNIYNLVTFYNQTGFDRQSFAFTADQAGFDGVFELLEGSLTFQVTSVPEPPTGWFILGSLILLGAWRRLAGKKYSGFRS